MSASTIALALAALEDKLVASPALAGVRIQTGYKRGDLSAKEQVTIGRVTSDQHAAALGQRRREEVYEIHVHISVLRQLGNQREANTRAFAILAVLEALLRDDVTDGDTLGRIVQIAEVTNAGLDVNENSELCEAHVPVVVTCRARI
jgi:hypothetical protein